MRLKKQYISAGSNKKILQNSDIYTLRSITAKDRGFDWDQLPTKSSYDLSLAPSHAYTLTKTDKVVPG